MRSLRKQVRLGLIGSVAVVAGLGGVAAFATAASAKPHPTTTTTTTTSTTIAPTTTTTPPTVPCTPASTTSSGGPPTLTADPGTCLTGGTPIAITGSGYDAKSLGIVLQCNSASGQPTVYLAIAKEQVPVSCTGIALANAITTSSTGTFSATWDAIDGVTGPPCGKAGDLTNPCPADSTGGDAATDAASYPCPPTPTQAAAGATCTIAFGDEAGKTATTPISFAATATPSTGGGGVPPSTTATTAPATASSTTGSTSGTAAAAAPTTAASSLAFTGPGTGLYIVGAAGLFMVLLGAAVLGLSGAPSSLVLALRRRRRTQ